MTRVLKWLLVAVLVVMATGIIMPWLARDAHDGSKKYARLWRDQLLACDSLEDVQNRFTCFEIEETPEGRLECVPETAKESCMCISGTFATVSGPPVRPLRNSRTRWQAVTLSKKCN